MIRKLFNGQTKTITSTAILIAIASLMSRLLGVFRDRILAGQFGAGAELDTYYAAFRVPDLVFNLLVLGALSAGFIPIFTSYLKRDELLCLKLIEPTRAWQLVNNLTNIILVALLLVAGILFFLSYPLMKLLTPGFPPEQLLMASVLTKIMLLSPIFLALSGIFGGVLQCFRRFFVYSIAPIFYNLGIILGAVFLAPRFGVYGLAFGVVLGAFLHFLIQVPAIISLGYHYHFFIDLKDKGLRQIIKLMVPRTLGLMISQLNQLIVTIIGSVLAAGSITIFNLAINLVSFPLGIFGISYAIAAFPTLSELADKRDEFIKNFSSTVRQILFFIIPATALLIILRAQIVRVILGSGFFDWEDTILTINTVTYLSISLFAQSLIPLFTRAFYAQRDSKTPFIIAFICAAINIYLSIKLSKINGVEGLALAFTLSNIFNFIILWIILRWRLKFLDELNILKSFLKVLLATAFMTAVAHSLKYLLEPYLGTETFVGIFLQGFIACLVGLIVFIAICVLTKSPEMIIFLDSFKKKFLKKIKFKPTELVE